MGDLYRQGADADAGYAERVLALLATALLKLSAGGEGQQGSAQVAEAKVRGRAGACCLFGGGGRLGTYGRLA